ncbi:MAG: cyclic nucleotide-binding domain-containing protein [candidate division WOR-3 bacterium]
MDKEWFKKLSYFGNLKEAEWDELVKIAREEKFIEGDIIFNQGDASTELYIVEKGAVEIRIRIAPQLADVIVYTAQENDIFGEFAFISPAPRSATASCAKETTVVAIKKEDFEELTKTFPNIGLNFYKNIAASLTDKLRKTNQFLRESLARACGLEV